SKCFITVSVGMVRASRCHQLNMKTYIINDSEVSRLSVAIHTVNGWATLLFVITRVLFETSMPAQC
ncbi:hypothetical protein, partial [Citrobacter sedlakii]|uniref:hypothetical protein n=1 Tax=Citrobacter sedlakii TaxID=67826 RepID=UPI003B431DBE